MLERDYLTRIIQSFSKRIRLSLIEALVKRSPDGIGDTEDAIGELCELEPSLILPLAPESFATMIGLNGNGELIADHLIYVLYKVSDAYKLQADAESDPSKKLELLEKSDLRRAQANAVNERYGYEVVDVPSDLVDLEEEIIKTNEK